MASAWGSSEITTRHAIFAPAGRGSIVDRERFDREFAALALSRQIPIVETELAGVEREQSSGRWQLRFANGLTASSKFVADASGRSRIFGRFSGTKPTVFDRLIAITAFAEPTGFPKGEALVESAEQGWWFSAVDSNGDLSVTWFTYPSLTTSARAQFEQALSQTIHTVARINKLRASCLISRTARTDWLDQPAGEGWLAVGDAAFASDPLGSQGLSRVFEMSQTACSFIANHLARNEDVVRQYTDSCVQWVSRFLTDREYFYGMERRWPDAPFWRLARDARTVPFE